ncbi:hypothetical protein GCM10010832_25100 [Psychroflexus planctonicus]|uniref:DUF4249 domain-containing protein n=2 Tax=Psychroflexus planctonicus TaxID=1526575 RepID=A0ABQ1SMM8_9FLAO|nr:hypothetical protein GCM10010832_25100 [Psychroflexus planctonicus]
MSLLIFTSCLDVVEVDLEEATPRVVFDASMKWENGEAANEQTIQVSRTRNFFEDEIDWVSGANIQIVDPNNTIVNFEEVEPGQYKTDAFLAEIDEEYQLEIELEGKSYQANEAFVNRTVIDTIVQGEDGGFTGGEKEVIVYFMDNVEEENYYLTRFNTDFLAFPEVDLQSDEFSNGNRMSSSFSDEDLESGDLVEIEFYSISKAYYDFLFKLLLQTGSAGGPFQAQPATVRGNIININDFDDYPFGYFSLSTFEKVSFTIE